MSNTIGTLAYRVKLDSTQFKEGLVATRSELAAAKRITEAMKQPFDRLAIATENLDILQKKNLITLAQKKALEKEIEKEYLQQEAATRRLTTAEHDRLKALRAQDQQLKTTAQDEAKLAQQMSRGREIIEQTRSSQDRLNRSLAEARQLYKAGAIDSATYAKHVAQLKKDAAGPGMLAGMGGAKGVIGGLAAAAGVGSALSVGKDAIMMTASVERAQATMEAFTGSTAAAAAILDDIRKLSSLAGISFSQLNEGASAMLGYGVTAEVVSKKLRQFAEISRGDSERFRAMALAFGQVNAAGRLMGQEVLQLVNAGFNPLQEISRTTGIEFATLKKMMEEGQISVDMVSRAFDTATSAGGRFNGVLGKIGETSAGSIGKMRAEWEQFLDALGKSLPGKAAADAASVTLRTGTTLLSNRQDAVSRRIEAAKASSGTGLDDLQLRVTGVGLPSIEQTDLAKAATIDRGLEARRKATDTNRRAKILDDQRAAAKKAEEERQARIKLQREQVDSIRQQQQQAMLDAKKQANPQQFEQFNRITEFLDEPRKKMATENFAKFGDINRLLPLLDKELQIELQKLDAIKKQSEEKQKSKTAAKEEIRKDDTSKTALKNATTAAGLTRDQHESASYQSFAAFNMAEMQLRQAEKARAQQIAMMQQPSPTQIRDQLAGLETQRQNQLAAHAPAQSIQAGSQAAYQQFIASQTRAAQAKDPQIKEIKKQTEHLKGIERSIKDLADKTPKMTKV